MNWASGWDVEYGEFSVFGVQVWRGGGAKTPVTFFRDVPTQITQLTYADPFGDATAIITFPQVTGFDSVSSVPWLREFTQIDIYRYPCTTTQWWPGEELVVNPLTNQRNLYLHTKRQDGTPVEPMWEGFIVSIVPTPTGTTVQCQGALYQLDYYYAKPMMPARPRSVESQIYRYFNRAYRGLYTQNLQIEWPDGWSRVYTQTEWDEAYSLSGKDVNGRYMPVDLITGASIGPGHTVTGYMTRYTGSWDKILTGYVQGQLSYMYAAPESGDTLIRGDQWTITKRPGRKPVMWLRQQAREHTCEVWYGQPGVEAQLTRDGTQVTNVMFAEGRGANQGGDTAWNLWRQPFPKAGWCIWQPIAAVRADTTEPHQGGLPPATGYGLYHFFDKYSPEPSSNPQVTGAVWPVSGGVNNVDMRHLPDGYDAAYERHFGYWISEKMVTFPDGIDEGTAREIAYNWVAQDSDPGWSGQITLQADPYTPDGQPYSKWDLRAGDILVLRGFQGASTSTIGVNKFHISQVQMDPMNGTVTLTVDTKFRDLLTVEEALAKGRDTLTPVKSLQVNKRSALINDLIVPWNVRQGSGLFPRMASTYLVNDSFPHSNTSANGQYQSGDLGFFQQAGNRPIDIFKPAYRNGGSGKPIGVEGADDRMLLNLPAGQSPTAYTGQVLQGDKEALFVPVHAGAADAVDRWAIYPILLSQAGIIMRSEFAVYDQYGNLAPVEFHVSIYTVTPGSVTVDSMPFHGQQSPLTTAGSFQKYNPETGYKYAAGDNTMPTVEPVVGWGNIDMPAGYSPKSKIWSLPTSGGNVPTGMLIDGAPWQYSFYPVGNFTESDPGYDITSSDVSAACAVYVEYQSAANYEWLYVYGRVYRGIND